MPRQLAGGPHGLTRAEVTASQRARALQANATLSHMDAQALAYPNDHFDSGVATFVFCNVPNAARGLREMARVLKPGGRAVILEITQPTRPPLSLFYSLWFDRVVPALGQVAGDSDAYTYLPSSVRRFPGPEELGGELAAAGLVDVRWVLTAGGIIALHVGTVPEA